VPKLYEILSPAHQLELAVPARSPHRLADTFASLVGQFYDRSDFDRLARQVSDLYHADSTESAHRFRARLDRRLHDRYRDPVAWDVRSARGSEAA
jgi:hypothetical protein